jgi:BON domain
MQILKMEISKSFHSSLPENDVLVRVYDGIVVLTGEVNSEQQKNTITMVILDVQGILNIWNFIHVKKSVSEITYKEQNKTTFPVNAQININRMQLKEPA